MGGSPPNDHRDLGEDREQLVTWVRIWQRAGAELDEHRRARLAAMTPDQMRAAIAAVFGAEVTSPLRRSSGLVEMQRLLSRLS